MVEEVSAWNTALKMLEEGLRPPIVHAATGLAKDKLRDTFRRIHGKSAIRGRVPENARRRFHNRLQVIEANAFFRIYKQLAGDNIYQQLNSGLVIDAYRIYKTNLSKNPIDATSAWYLARDLREGLVEVHTCQHCGNEFLYDRRSDYLRRCLLCQA